MILKNILSVVTPGTYNSNNNVVNYHVYHRLQNGFL